jgi:predicted esterase
MSNRDLTRPHVFEAGSNDRVLLLLHGTGADEFDLLRLGKAIDADASLLSPRGMYLEGGMNRFFERYSDGSFNEASVDEAVDELADFIAAASEHYSLAGKKFVAVGFSNGANTAAALMVRRPELLDGAVLFGSTKPYASLDSIDLTGKRIWLANGDQDPYAPVSVSEAWVAWLRQSGADVTWLRHPGGHQISPAHVETIREDLAK